MLYSNITQIACRATTRSGKNMPDNVEHKPCWLLLLEAAQKVTSLARNARCDRGEPVLISVGKEIKELGDAWSDFLIQVMAQTNAKFPNENGELDQVRQAAIDAACCGISWFMPTEVVKFLLSQGWDINMINEHVTDQYGREGWTSAQSMDQLDPDSLPVVFYSPDLREVKRGQNRIVEALRRTDLIGTLALESLSHNLLPGDSGRSALLDQPPQDEPGSPRPTVGGGELETEQNDQPDPEQPTDNQKTTTEPPIVA